MNKTSQPALLRPGASVVSPFSLAQPRYGNILVISSDSSGVAPLCENLHNYGYQVEYAFSSARAVELLKNRPCSARRYRPGLIICDMGAGEQDSLHFLRNLRGAGLPYIPIMLLAEVESNPGFDKAVMDLGVDDFMVKPVRSAELYMRVRSLLR